MKDSGLMKDAGSLHRRAMELADEAIAARARKDYRGGQERFRAAFELERQAAQLVAPTDIEPTRSILHRSAATLALDCREFGSARELASIALEGNPPAELRQELQDVLEAAESGLRDPLAGSAALSKN